MPARRLEIPQLRGAAVDDVPEHVPADIVERLAAIRTELAVPAVFPAEVTAAAEAAVRAPRLPALDRTDLELITIDPPGSVDLDQALHIARDGDGFVVSYAIADVGAFVSPGDPVDLESHRRGQTLYAPDHRTLLYPPELGEGAASLLPEQVRPALLWTIRLGPHGRTLDAEVARALVRSRRQLTYEAAQADIEAPAIGGTAGETLQLLRTVGRLREARERQRGGVSLETGEQEVQVDGDVWSLRFRAALPVEGWNAQISLLTGICAAHLMMYGQIGILRTLPPADQGALTRLHRTAKALRIPWPAELDYPEFVRSLDPTKPAHAAMINACTRLFRGAGYQSFSGGVPEQAEHAALAIEYAHVTAPLRRLADRYAGEICVALCADEPVPTWVRTALDALPAEMQGSDRRAKAYDRAIIDAVEALVLRPRLGEVFTGTVLEVDEKRGRGTIMITDPAVEARIYGPDLPLGHELAATLVSADVATGAVRFAPA